MQEGDRLTFIYYVVSAFYTGMNYAKRYDKCVVLQ